MISRYQSRYPRQGRVAILCEGDLAGFEADLLEKWTAADEYVDVWPCGTKTALLGVSDAIGRSVPIVVVEDRDYRNADDAKKDCESKAKDCRKRAVNIVQWTSWNRHEIENYLIEPAVLVPVLSEVFAESEDVVGARLESVLGTVHVEQAALATRAHFLGSLPDRNSGKFAVGLPPTARPKWNPERSQFEIADESLVSSELENAMAKASERFRAEENALDIQGCLQRFHDYVQVWCGMTVESPVWREEWAGKEVLTYALRWLAGEFGWRTSASQRRDRIDWSGMKQAQVRDREREMIEAIQPKLVGTFLDLLESAPANQGVGLEWDLLRKMTISAATEAPHGPPTT